MAKAFIGLGSNLGQRRANLLAGWRRLEGHPRIRCLQISSPYETAPVDMASLNWFTNAVGKLETELSPEELLKVMLAVEREMGRDRHKGQDRIIDLDLLFYDDLVQEDPSCRIPHPEVAQRLFVLVPLAEIAPGFRHPETHLNPAAMIAKLNPAGQEIRQTEWEGEG